MGWIARLFQGSEVDRARSAAEASRERTDEEARSFERWLAAAGAKDDATKAAAHAHLRNATAAAERGDLPGWLEAREQLELARAVYGRGRAALALAHPRETASLLLADAAEDAAGIRDIEERSARAATVAEFQAWSGDIRGARLTLDAVSEPADRATVERAILIAHATSESTDASRLGQELARAGSGEWNHEEILLAIVEEKCRRRDVAGAQPLLAAIDDPSLKARACRFLARAEARAGRLNEARAITSRIEDPQWSAAAWADFALAQATHGDLAGALATVEGISDEGARDTALGALAGALVEAGNDAKASELLERITDPQARDDALTWIAEARARKGDLAGAATAIEGVQDAVVQGQELVALAEAARAAGKQEVASDYLQQALEAFETHRSTHNLSPLWLARFLVDARSRLGEFDAAEAAVQAIGEERERAELLGPLAHQLARRPGGGLVALEGLLERHPGVLERIAIQLSGAQGLLSLAEERAAKSTPSSVARDSESP
jgi:hypothetical protein